MEKIYFITGICANVAVIYFSYKTNILINMMIEEGQSNLKEKINILGDNEIKSEEKEELGNKIIEQKDLVEDRLRRANDKDDVNEGGRIWGKYLSFVVK